MLAFRVGLRKQLVDLILVLALVYGQLGNEGVHVQIADFHLRLDHRAILHRIVKMGLLVELDCSNIDQLVHAALPDSLLLHWRKSLSLARLRLDLKLPLSLFLDVLVCRKQV